MREYTSQKQAAGGNANAADLAQLRETRQQRPPSLIPSNSRNSCCVVR
jgi:hypothetical protein